MRGSSFGWGSIAPRRLGHVPRSVSMSASQVGIRRAARHGCSAVFRCMDEAGDMRVGLLKSDTRRLEALSL